MGEKYNESTGYRLNPVSKRWEKVNKDDGHGSKTGGSAKDAMSDYATGGKDYTAEEAERFIDSVFYDLDEEIESGIHDDLVDTEIMIECGENSPFYDWEYPETGIYEEPYFDEAVASFCRDRGPVSEKEKRMLLESNNIVARIIGENMEVNSGSNYTTADFQIDNGVINELSPEGRSKLTHNGGVIDSFPDEVTAIDDRAFANSDITAIKDWGQITSIGDSAFFGNQITTLPDSWGDVTTIDDGAFYGNQITTLPDSWGQITSIGKSVFRGNQITALPDSWGGIASVSNYVFDSNQITALPDSWGGVTSIGDSAFRNNQITALPDSWGGITSIDDSAFEHNQITTLPDSWGGVTSIGDSAFGRNQITILPDSWGGVTSVDDYAFYENQITTLPES